MATHKKVDVVTIGGGWTAAILGWKLASAGHEVLSLEMGPARWANPDFEQDHDPLRYHVRHAQMVDLSKETWTWRPNPNAPTLPMRQYGSFNPGAGLGGSGIHWSGMLWRFLPSDFRYRSHHIQRYGESHLPQGNRIQDWPITYEELEPYYDQTEYDIGASGQTGNLGGQILPGGNPFEGPRQRAFPLPPLPSTLPGNMFSKAAADLGYHPFPQPAGITSQAFVDPFGNHRGGCLLCGFCTRYGCEVDAKASPINTHLPPALKTGRYAVRTNAKVIRINTGADGLATGVTYVDENNQEQEQPANLVLLTAYTLSNVRLLLLSADDRHPHGVGNDRGLVGKNYTYQHWHNVVNGVFPGRRFNLFMGNTSTQNVIYDFNADNFDHSELDFVGGGSLFATEGERDPLTTVDSYPIKDSRNQPSSGPPSAAQEAEKAKKQVAKAWGKDWKDSLRAQWNSTAFITMQGESLPYEDQFLDLDPVYKDNHGLPLLRLTFDWHANDYNMYRFVTKKAQDIMEHMGAQTVDAKSELEPYNIHEYQSTHCTGGAIMGTDPGNSVCNKYGQVWDTPNVFVAGAALYPQNPGANPTGTLLALTYMAGDAIRDSYFKAPDRLIG